MGSLRILKEPDIISQDLKNLLDKAFELLLPLGKGRTGRIINILYLMLRGVLKHPINLSSSILKTKQRYYYLLQKGSWE